MSLSDSLNNKNLLRFYVPNGFTPVDPKNYDYKNDFAAITQIQSILQRKSTSLWSKNDNHTTIDDYKSDAPELKTTDKNDKSVAQAESKASSTPTSTGNKTQQ